MSWIREGESGSLLPSEASIRLEGAPGRREGWRRLQEKVGRGWGYREGLSCFWGVAGGFRRGGMVSSEASASPAGGYMGDVVFWADMGCSVDKVQHGL